MSRARTDDVAESPCVAVVDCGEEDEHRLKPLIDATPTRVFHGSPDVGELVERASGAQVLVTLYTYTRLGAEVIDKLPELKLIATRTAGHTHIDARAAARAGVDVATVPSAASPSVAEYVFGALIAAQRGLFDARDATRAGSWRYQDYRGFELMGSVLGVVGLGEIGRRVAHLGRGFGMEVVGFSRSGRPLDDVEPVPLEELLARSDVVSLNVALTPETLGMIGPRELSLMKPTAWLVNAARGGILDEEALARRLRDGLLGGAVLDVVQPEPPAPERLVELGEIPNLIVTPHIAWHTEAALERQFAETIENVLAFLRGEPRNLITSTGSEAHQ